MEGCTARLSCTPLAIGSCLPGRSGVLRGSGKGVEASGGSGRKVRRTQLRCAYSSGSSRSDDAMGGDPRVQQMLVEMVQIQLGKARMNDFVDERSEYMRMIADEAQREYNRIAMRTMKGLDATGSRVSQLQRTHLLSLIRFYMPVRIYTFRCDDHRLHS